MAEKKYKGRKAYLNDFKKNAQGDYEYQGNLYEWKVTPKERQKKMILLWILGTGMLSSLVTAVCLDAPGALNCIYVILPAAISFVFGISVVWAMWKFAFTENPMREYVFKATIEAMSLRTICVMGAAGAAVLGELIYLILHGADGNLFGAAVFLVSEGIGLLFALMIRKNVMDIHENTDKMSNEN